MKKIFLFSIASILFFGCVKNEGPAKESTEKVLLSGFHRTRIQLRSVDSSDVIGDQAISYDVLFLNKDQFNNYKKLMFDFVSAPQTKIYRYLPSEPLNEKDKKQFLADGGDNFKGDVNIVDCDEAWYFDPATNSIERETLGYWIYEYVKEKVAYRQLCYISKNDAALKKVVDAYYDHN